MTKKSEALLEQLVAVAGDAELVEEALRSLTEETDAPLSMRDIVRRILELRDRRDGVMQLAR